MLAWLHHKRLALTRYFFHKNVFNVERVVSIIVGNQSQKLECYLVKVRVVLIVVDAPAHGLLVDNP